ncbi:hypothetical protein SARC_13814 [Sphaeroforma arctica JP610]|uniref:Copper transport protein n=1 Tax=Sphaeroforma arctica JP610 TaxID=667725 RepID=A0A0L0FC29_9EUKA|nr:hypothetical protein SARC_13814 [Sphaeroforma arctica JP610]KNC73628.1 hypothetical protein SARC_13814 [Sphaeroforma arctica JP610]|eukprot:XP_014147530.1 hypothetical protein SARC_13814 [Sphaeroforma arctica JP610]
METSYRRRQSTITYVEPKAECPFCGMSGIHEHALNFNGSQAVYACSMSEHYTRIYQQEDLQSAFSGVVAGIDAESTGNDTAVPEQQDEPFCYGSGTVMLNGFTFNMDNCITYLFDGWVLDTPFKYAGATVLTFLVTVFVQVLSKVRMKLEQAQVKSQLADQRQPRVSELLLNSSLVLVSVTFGYWVMLLTMTYSVILFLAVVFGLAVGHFLTNFFTHREITNPFSEYHTSGEAPRISSLHAVVVDTDSEEKKETYCHEDAESISDLMHDPSSPDSGKASEAVTKDSPAPKALPDTPCCPY